MQVVALTFFSAALLLSLAVIAQMLIGHRARIIDALLSPSFAPEIGPSAEVIYLQPRNTPEIEWRNAA